MHLRFHPIVLTLCVMATACGTGDAGNAAASTPVDASPSAANATPAPDAMPKPQCAAPPCVVSSVNPDAHTHTHTHMHMRFAHKWAIVEVRIDGKDQPVDAPAGSGPSLWLKRDGSAVLDFMLGPQPGTWAIDADSKTLTLVDADATTHFSVMSLDEGRMILRSVQRSGEFDVEAMVLVRETAP